MNNAKCHGIQLVLLDWIILLSQIVNFESFSPINNVVEYNAEYKSN